MKSRPLLSLLFSVIWCTHTEAATTLVSGESLSFTFANMDVNTGIGFSWPIFVSVGLQTDYLSIGESVRVEFYEDSLFQVPWWSQDLTNLGVISSTSLMLFSNDETRWADLNGAIRISVLNGSIDFNQVGVFRNLGGTQYIASAIPIPEPASSMILTLTLMVGLSIRCRAVRQTREFNYTHQIKEAEPQR